MCEQRIVMKRRKKIPNSIKENNEEAGFYHHRREECEYAYASMPLQSEACGIKDENWWIVEMIQPDSD